MCHFANSLLPHLSPHLSSSPPVITFLMGGTKMQGDEERNRGCAN